MLLSLIHILKWLWYPYIPFGKVTLLQGDPGDGKSKLMLSIAALLSKGEPLPFTDEEIEPMTIIYQTTEDDADAVSYTHLDVYKRQVLPSSSTPRPTSPWQGLRPPTGGISTIWRWVMYRLASIRFGIKPMTCLLYTSCTRMAPEYRERG